MQYTFVKDKYGNEVLAAVAFTGDRFDATNSIHEHFDNARYAVMLQELRDVKDYSAADKLRTMLHNIGAYVLQTKNYTIVTENNLYVDFTEVPSWDGFISWVPVGQENGRNIIDRAYDRVSKKVTLVAVENWKNHPNLQKAKDLGLPETLWTYSGQKTLAFSTNVDWFNGQLTKLEKILNDLTYKKLVNRLVNN